MVLRVYCRVAAMVFLLFTLYPLITKVLEQRLAHDWAHGLLHLISAAIGIYAGWFARSDTLAALYTWTIAIVYTTLGIGGWFIDGLFLGTAMAIPLGPVDHAFHLLLGLAAVAVLLVDRHPVRNGQ
ncbi:MAG TPA: hypothetical protein VFC19_36700 [Candidatus Limnocylindrales bacterium]|nr:hypothetical protein [Candidatus Limnocylindrales bacterium]